MSAIQYEFRDVAGQKLHIASRGLRTDGVPPLLILNGIGASSNLLEPLLLKLKIPSLTFDLPGIGASPARLLPSRMPDLADLAVRLLDELGITRVHVMGVSWGGGLAQQFVYQHPERSDCLILAATSTGHLMLPPGPGVLLRMATPLRYFSSYYFRKIAGDIYGGDFRVDQARVSTHVRRMAPPSLWGYLGQLYAMTGWTSAFFLHKITQPTLVMAGTDDPIIPLANARFLADRIPNARLDLYDCGHLFLLTRLERAVASIESFVAAQRGVET
jgi:poly(3-hydroxyalkanoate) depolymerase